MDLSTLANVASVLGSVGALAYWLGRRFARVNSRFEGLERRLGGVDGKVEGLRSLMEARFEGLYTFNVTLIEVLSGKAVGGGPLLTQGEVEALKALARAVAAARSRYYTKEVYQRLMELLDKDLEAYTWDDVRELKRIARLMMREAEAVIREDRDYAEELVESSVKVRIFAAALEGYLARKAVQTSRQTA